MIDKVIKQGDFITFKMRHPKLGLKFIRRKIIEIDSTGLFSVRGQAKDSEMKINPSDVIRHVAS